MRNVSDQYRSTHATMHMDTHSMHTHYWWHPDAVPQKVSVPDSNVIKLPAHSHTDLSVQQSTVGITTASPETKRKTAEHTHIALSHMEKNRGNLYE